MNVRLKKEFRGLFWPWLITILLGLLPLINWLVPGGRFEFAIRSLYLVSGSGFVLGVGLLSAMPFGEELNLRTLPMLLAQPCDRWQIWREKLRIAILLTGSVALVHIIGYLPYWNMIHDVWLMASAFLLFSVCSSAFWVLFTRSTIGGTVICLFCQATTMLLVSLYTQKKYYMLEIWRINAEAAKLILTTSLILSPVFLWLSWRLFLRFQEFGNWADETSASKRASVYRTRFSWLRISTSFPTRNLLLKELHLFRPIFIMAFLFTCLWLATDFAYALAPERQKSFSNFLNGITSIYSPVILLLSGCISLSEEKRLGFHQFNLALPVSLKKQWFLKLVSASLVGLSAGLLLPLSLAFFESHAATNVLDTWFKDLLNGGDMLGISILLFLLAPSLSFWAATVLPRTPQAAFLAGFSLIPIVTFHSLGKNHDGTFLMGISSWIIDWMTARWQLELGWATDYYAECFFLSYAAIGLIFPYLCWRSYRIQQATGIQIFKSFLIFSTASFICGAIFNDIQLYSRNHDASPLFTETQSALHAIGVDGFSANTNAVYDGSFLYQTHRLSPRTMFWLRGSTFTISQVKNPYSKEETFNAVIDLNLGHRLTGYVLPMEKLPEKHHPRKERN